MNPSTPPSNTSRQGTSFLLGMLLGGLIGFVIATVLVGAASYLWAKRKAVDVRRGWNLVPVVVASHDIPENTVLTYDMINQRSVPEQFVTSSIVKPDSATYVVGQRLLAAAQAGDLNLWSQFETAKNLTPGLIATRDIPVGVRLTTEDVELREIPPGLVTPSYVKDAERPQVVGRSVIAAFRKGDPILWTHFQNAP